MKSPTAKVSPWGCAELTNGALGVLSGEKRQGGVVLAELFAVGVVRILFLEVGGVSQEDCRQFLRRRGAVRSGRGSPRGPG